MIRPYGAALLVLAAALTACQVSSTGTAPPPPPTTTSPAQQHSLAGVDWAKTIDDIDCVDAGNLGIWIDGTTTGELRGNGVQDTVVWFECAHQASSWPGQVEVFDGSSDPAAPRRLGVPLPASEQLNGRLIRVRNVTVSGGRVELDLAAYTATDPMCCPSLDVRRSYTWTGGGFALTPSAG